MKLPSRKECIQMLKKRNPENIVVHSLKVEEVALFLSKKIREKGIAVNEEFVSRAALLHDIDKWGQVQHGFEFNKGQKMLEEKGYKELAQMVEKSHLTAILEQKLNSWEEKIVFYSDKRVNPDERVVSLGKRFGYIEKRYGSNAERLELIKKSEKKVIALEKEIFEKLGITPELAEVK